MLIRRRHHCHPVPRKESGCRELVLLISTWYFPGEGEAVVSDLVVLTDGARRHHRLCRCLVEVVEA